jgi:thiol-disulfide isomerase/thioredoxin
VHQLQSVEDFDAFLAGPAGDDARYVLVALVAPTCAHCKKFAPVLAKAADTLAASDADISLATVDASTDATGDLLGRYALQGFPSLLLIARGAFDVASAVPCPLPAEGASSASSELVDWVTKAMRVMVLPIEDREELEGLVRKSGFLVIMAQNPDGVVAARAQAVFRASAQENSQLLYVQTWGGGSQEVWDFLQGGRNALQQQQENTETSVLYACLRDTGPDTPLDVQVLAPSSTAPDSSQIGRKALTRFALKHRLPDVVKFDEAMSDVVFGGTSQAFLFAFVDGPTAAAASSGHAGAGSGTVIGRMRTVAGQMPKGLVSFLFVDADDASSTSVLEYFKVKGISRRKRERRPAAAKPFTEMRFLQYDERLDDFHRFAPTREMLDSPNLGQHGITSEQGIAAFLREALAGKLSVTVASDPLPNDWDAGNVKVVVGSSHTAFTEAQPDRGMVMLYHTASCAHCRTFMPIFHDLAARLSHRDDVTFGTLDISKNDVRIRGERDANGIAIEIETTPTVLLYKSISSGGDTIIFDGAFTVDSVAQMLVQHVPQLVLDRH